MLRVPRLPLVPDPLRRITVPDELDPITSVADEADPEPLGVSRETVERIWQSGVDLYRSGVHPALTLCVRRHGQVILDRAIGHARGSGPQDNAESPKILATPETPFCVYSTSKAYTAIVVHTLVEEGVLSLEDRITDYIPKYGAHGKGDTTIAHVLSHRAGVPTLPEDVFDLDRIDDREYITSTIAKSKPFVKPGGMLAYHAVSGGFILAEVVERATGRALPELLRERILDPLGFRWGNYGVAEEDLSQVATNYANGSAPATARLHARPSACSDCRGTGWSSSPTTHAFLPPCAERQRRHHAPTSSRASLRSSAAVASSTAYGSCGPRRCAPPSPSSRGSRSTSR